MKSGWMLHPHVIKYSSRHKVPHMISAVEELRSFTDSQDAEMDAETGQWYQDGNRYSGLAS